MTIRTIETITPSDWLHSAAPAATTDKAAAILRLEQLLAARGHTREWLKQWKMEHTKDPKSNPVLSEAAQSFLQR